jgi:hypothetical protein
MKTLKSFRLSEEAIQILDLQDNATQFIEDLILGKAPSTPGVAPGVATEVFVPKPPDPETGYPCCQRKSPCRHWQWSSDKEAWVNTLTGASKGD